ncbi:MAG: superoxide dismutase [Planctomyces sp.]|nr:superoxide dismutase [Planctomyces sp.]
MSAGAVASALAGAGARGQERQGKPVDDFWAQRLGYSAQKGVFELPPLPFAPEALEPHIDAQTMTLHHGRHHQAYVNGLNAALKKLGELRDGAIEPALYRHWTRELAFNAAGHANHTLFWGTLAGPSAGGGGRPAGPLLSAIDRDFGSFEKFEGQFKATAAAVEGNGWAWLVVHRAMPGGRLMVSASERQQDLYFWGSEPILGVDVWEHAYYLKYQNRRSDYLGAFMNVIDWAAVSARYAAIVGP